MKKISFLILTFASATSFAQASKPLKGNSVMSVSCYSKNKNLLSQANACKSAGSAHSYALITLNNEKALVVNGAKKMKCILTETLAKKNRVPFELLADMISSRRIDLQCSYSLPRSSEETAADSFSIRAYLE